MKHIIFSATILVTVLSGLQADPPCFGRRVCVTPFPTEVKTAVAVTPGIAVEVPVPTFFFQNLTAYLPTTAVATAPVAQQPVTPVAQAASAVPPTCLSDECLEKLSNLLAAKLAAQGPSAGPKVMRAADPEEPVMATAPQLTQAIAQDLANRCYECHSDKAFSMGLGKGKLSLFDERNAWAPRKTDGSQLRSGVIWERVQAHEMPPKAANDPAHRLGADAQRWLQASGL